MKKMVNMMFLDGQVISNKYVKFSAAKGKNKLPYFKDHCNNIFIYTEKSYHKFGDEIHGWASLAK